MLGVFEACTLCGIVGLGTMAGFAMGHGHVGDGHGHVGHSPDLNLDGGHGLHVDPGAHGAHIDAGPGHVDAGVGHFVPGHAHAGHGHGPHPDGGHGHGHGHADECRSPLWFLPSPISVFSGLVGFGAAGMILSAWLGYTTLVYVLALANALVFERFIVRPYWSFFYRFVSEPGTSLEGAVAGRAVAVTSFDANGRGLVRLCVDGQEHDVLGRLMPASRGQSIRKGDVLFVERANPDNSVLVSRQDSSAKE